MIYQFFAYINYENKTCLISPNVVNTGINFMNLILIFVGKLSVIQYMKFQYGSVDINRSRSHNGKLSYLDLGCKSGESVKFSSLRLLRLILLCRLSDCRLSVRCWLCRLSTARLRLLAVDDAVVRLFLVAVLSSEPSFILEISDKLSFKI